MEVPFLDLARDVDTLPFEDVMGAVEKVVRGGRFVGGPPVQTFEENFAAYCGTSHAVGCGNGLDALFLALRALDIGAGDEVIVPAHTFVATWLAVSRVGAIPVPVDVCATTACIDPELIEDAITDRTRAIIVVHLYGHIPDMGPVLSLAKASGIAVIEDAAQAHGAERGGKRAGAIGDIAAFSFYPVKNLGAWGDAGAVTTNNGALADRVRRLADYGRSGQHVFLELGVNSRLDPIQATVLSAKLERLAAQTARRRAIAAAYDTALAGAATVRPLLAPGEPCVWHQYVVVAENRERVQATLSERGVGTGIHYPVPPFCQPCYSSLGFDASQWPVSMAMAKTVLSLPIFPYLTDAEVQHVADALGTL